MIRFKQYFRLLNEGGAAGHMAHPFDIPSITTGNQLVQAFNKAWKKLKNEPGSVKIDGINVSFKVVGNEFALDRGSMKPIDVEGITLSRIKERFPEGHGLAIAASTMLTFLNEAFNEALPYLKKLGLIKNPNRFINAEYVSGTTNVTAYSKNFLAFHGINEFVQVTPKRRESHEVEYDTISLNKLAKIVEKYSTKYNFEVVTSVPTQPKGEPDFQSVLEQPFTVNYSENHSVTQTLGQWLQKAKNPFGYRITLTDGRKIGALSKETYIAILNGNLLSSFIKDKKDYQQAIDGAVFYHATRILGNQILQNLTSEMGDVSGHEGVVVRGVFSRPVKITGEFIVRGMESAFQK